MERITQDPTGEVGLAVSGVGGGVNAMELTVPLPGRMMGNVVKRKNLYWGWFISNPH